MSTVTVSAKTFEQGQFPETCARTGVAAAEQFRLVAPSREGAVRKGAVPLAQYVVVRLRRAQRVAVGGTVAAAALFALAVATSLELLWVLAFIAVVTALAAMFVLRFATPRARLSADGTQVVLAGVHDAFASAVAAKHDACLTCPAAGSCQTEDPACATTP